MLTIRQRKTRDAGFVAREIFCNLCSKIPAREVVDVCCEVILRHSAGCATHMLCRSPSGESPHLPARCTPS